jgi:hypothetical protein
MSSEVFLIHGPRNLQVIDLSSDDIRTLNSQPVTIIPAQGLGTVVVPISCVFQYDAGTVGFTNDDSLSFGVGAKPVLNSGTGPDGTVVFSVPISQVTYFVPLGDNEPQANHENGPAVLSADTTDPGGSGNGTARISVEYYVMRLRP